MRKQFCFILANLFFVAGVLAQELHYAFTNLNEKNGLKNNIVFSFLKDSHGILWVGTQNGLNRFDGTHFYSFKAKKEAGSLPNNTVHSLCEDKKGNIWGGTDNGIFCYTPSLNRFTTYNAPNDCYDNIISNIFCDKEGIIFAATSLALIKFNRQQNKFQRIVKLTNNADSAGWYIISKNRVLRDEKNGGFWIATRSGLLFYDNEQHKLLGSLNSPNIPLFEKRSAAALSRSPKGYYWFCDNGTKEIISFDPSSKKILQRISIKNEAPNAGGATIIEDSKRRLWVSSWSYDLLTIDLANNNKIERVKGIAGNSNTVAADFFWAAREDENGSIWLGTPNGISICNPNKSLYKACLLPGKIPALNAGVINIVEEDATDKTWWIVTNNLKLVHYYPASGKSKIYDLEKSIPDKSGLRPHNINRLRFIDGCIVITSLHGAWQLVAGAKQFVPYTSLPVDFTDFVIKDIIQADSVFYFSDGLSLLAWNKKTGKTGWITNRIEGLNPKIKFGFNDLLCKPGQPLYWTLFGDYIGTIKNNYQANLIKIVMNDSVEAGGYFHSADMDNEGNIWVINKGVGLYKYNTASKKVKYWNEFDGLVGNHLHAIKADDKGNIWTSYFNKISVFNSAKNSFVNFDIPYSENKLNYLNWLTKRADGVVMGTIGNEVFEFYAGSLNLVPVKKAPAFCVINISGKDFFITTETKLQLNPDENSLRFNFGLLIDATLYPYEFEYLLQGFDKKWIHASAGNNAVYNNLAPGTYTFRLVAKGRNNAWESVEKQLTVIIKTPFYKTIWFRALILLLLFAGLYIFYRYRILQKEKLLKLEGKAQLLEKEKTMVMYESLKQQLNPHFLFNSLTSLSGLIETDHQVAGDFLEQMSGIYRYILKNGDNETVPLKIEIEFVQLYVNLQQTRFKKGLQVNINVPEDYQHYKIAPVTLQNLIENAIKHNIIDASAPLTIDIFIAEEYLVVRNKLQKKNVVETSNKKGLAQFVSLYRYLSHLPVLIAEDEKYFEIRVPLI